VKNGSFHFPRPQAIFCAAPLDAPAPNQLIGPSPWRTAWGTRGLLSDANALRIRRLGAQHPVESYGQSPGRRYFGHAFRLTVAAVLTLLAKSLIQLYFSSGAGGTGPRFDFFRKLFSRAETSVTGN